MDVVQLDHLLRADDREPALFARIEPAQLDLRQNAARKLQVHEDHVLNATLQVRAAARAHGDVQLVDEVLKIDRSCDARLQSAFSTSR